MVGTIAALIALLVAITVVDWGVKEWGRQQVYARLMTAVPVGSEVETARIYLTKQGYRFEEHRVGEKLVGVRADSPPMGTYVFEGTVDANGRISGWKVWIFEPYL